MSGLVLKALAVIGGYKIFTVLLGLWGVIWDTLIPRAAAVQPYRAKKGDSRTWAIVTGATAGIGEEFAHQLARAGFNVGLISRTQSRLDAVAAEIQTKYQVDTSTFALNAASASASNYATLGKWTQSLGPVTVLINNVGQSHDIPVPFLETEHEEMLDIIKINNIATLEITKIVLPQIIATNKERSLRGLVLTVGSFAGLTPTPLLATYAGSKSFLQGWSSALAAEMESVHVDVQLILSYTVTSKMSKIRRSSMMTPTPKQFVASTLRTIGRHGGSWERAYTVTPYWSHALFHYAIESTLGVYSSIVAGINLKMHKQIRHRALKKRAKAQ